LPSGHSAPYGHPPPLVDPLTGIPYSDKSKLTAGLLQLLLGLLVCVGGVGRLYAGNGAMGGLQVGASALAWISLCCLGWVGVGVILFLAAWIWFIVDGIVMLTGRPVDGHGRPLRP
jgi:TM2 domain-containing membrane protein YozV